MIKIHINSYHFFCWRVKTFWDKNEFSYDFITIEQIFRKTEIHMNLYEFIYDHGWPGRNCLIFYRKPVIRSFFGLSRPLD